MYVMHNFAKKDVMKKNVFDYSVSFLLEFYFNYYRNHFPLILQHENSCNYFYSIQIYIFSVGLKKNMIVIAV